MVTTFLLIVAAALPAPRYAVEGLVLTQAEAEWLQVERLQYEREQLDRVRAIGTRVAEVDDEIAELETARDALEPGAERDARDAQIAAIRSGTIERGKLAVERLEKRARPMAADARRVTLRVVYNPDNGEVRHDPNGDGTVSQAEAGWPKFLFDAVDSDRNGQLTAQELTNYWRGL